MEFLGPKSALIKVSWLDSHQCMNLCTQPLVATYIAWSRWLFTKPNQFFPSLYLCCFITWFVIPSINRWSLFSSIHPSNPLPFESWLAFKLILTNKMWLTWWCSASMLRHQEALSFCSYPLEIPWLPCEKRFLEGPGGDRGLTDSTHQPLEMGGRPY